MGQNGVRKIYDKKVECFRRIIPVHPLEGGADLARDSLGARLADAAVRRHVGGEVAHGGVLGGEHVVAVRLRERECMRQCSRGWSIRICLGNEADFNGCAAQSSWHLSDLVGLPVGITHRPRQRSYPISGNVARHLALTKQPLSAQY